MPRDFEKANTAAVKAMKAGRSSGEGDFGAFGIGVSSASVFPAFCTHFGLSFRRGLVSARTCSSCFSCAAHVPALLLQLQSQWGLLVLQWG